jgi:hypothetical protein
VIRKRELINTWTIVVRTHEGRRARTMEDNIKAILNRTLENVMDSPGFG